MSHLRLTLLGGFQAHLDEQPLTDFVSNKVRALLIYLVLEAERAHDRAHLAGLFWPDWSETRARTNLRHALSNLRQLLCDKETDPPFLLVTRQTLRFNLASHHTVDVRTLAALLSPNELPASAPSSDRVDALMQYSAPLLSGFFLDGCPEFEAWLLLTRERLQRQVLHALQALALCYERESDDQQALVLARRAVELEPWREEAHRHVMRLLAYNGQRSAALAQYERCVRVLRDELSVAPGDETVALYTQIVDGSMPERSAQATHQIQEDEARPIVQSHNLPAQLTSLVGRQAEKAAVLGLFHVDDARLVTLTGPGGVGKTRLALEVATALLDDVALDVHWISLVSIRESALVPSAIAEVMQIASTGSCPLLERLQEALRHRHALLLLDNFEQVLDAALVVAALLSACPHLRILVTSRERLSIEGEYEYVTPPLPLPFSSPQPQGAPVLSDLAAFPAVQLFCQRARAARHHFALTAQNAHSIAAICARLDGLPLAIELAAARMKLFSADALLQRLTAEDGQSRSRFLTTNARGRLPRHRSLWDTIAWSYTLLEPEEQLLFRRLSIFVGGWTLEAAASVCADQPQMAADMLEWMITLVDKSLVRQINNVPPLRFTMLETIREFGLEELEKTEEFDVLQRSHAEYFLKLAESAIPYLESANQELWLQRLDPEHDNLRAALSWAQSACDIETGLRLGAALPRYWMRRGYDDEGFVRLRALLNAFEGSILPPPVEDVLYYTGLFSLANAEVDVCESYLIQAAIASQRVGNKYQLAYSLGLQTEITFDQGRFAESVKLMAETMALARDVDDTFGLAMCLVNHGKHLALWGEPEAGRRICEAGLALNRQLGDKWGILVSLRCMIRILVVQGCFADALAYGQEALKIVSLQKLDDRDDRYVLVEHELAFVYLEMGEWEKSSHCGGIALIHFAERGNIRYLVQSFTILARLASVQEQPTRALILAGVTTVLLRRRKSVLPPVVQEQFDRMIITARSQLGVVAADVAWNTGINMGIDEAVAFALSHV